MAAVIGLCQSVRFRKQDSSFRNFDNTLVANELFYNDKIFTYCQRFGVSDAATIQLKSTSNTVPTCTGIKADRTEVDLPAVLASSYDTTGDGNDDLFFFEFDIPFSLFPTRSYATVVQDADSWISEPFFYDTNLAQELADGEVHKIDYYNNDNAFEIDFSTGITFTFYVESILKDYGADGEVSNYDNQDELTKLKETVQRLLTFRTVYIPRFLAETLKLASAMDNFLVNEVSFVRDEQPEIIPVEGSNLIEYSMTLNDKEYLGVNTHDIGFSCDTTTTEGESMVLTILGASGSETFSIPAGYLVHTLRSQWVSGAAVEVKLGTSISGDNLVYPRNITSVETDRTTSVHGDIDRDSDTDIYATVTGGVANLDLQIIKNTE